MWRKILRSAGLIAYALLVAVVFVVCGYLAFSGFVRSGTTTVPKVAGLSIIEAENLLREKGLVPKQGTADRYDPQVPAGRIAGQSPDAGSWVKRGSAVELVASRGPQRIDVPGLTGRALPAAQFTLGAVGLGVGRALAVFASGNPGVVIEQDPPAGAAVPPATPVDLLVALPSAGERYVMPDLIYRHYDDVRPAFERQGFRLGSVKFEPYEGVSSGVILRQFPLAGHPVSHQDAISLVVATADRLPEPPPS
ncbi:MAG TPA: PASTA domain-containing protein [Thermoanaerobaculia bacterium]|jgi:serine/threonine-protein kinase|nr:PASTA domain-containing protein [Thermoanaerobaculia bacterium]